VADLSAPAVEAGQNATVNPERPNA
jgi:hypothetical protein